MIPNHLTRHLARLGPQLLKTMLPEDASASNGMKVHHPGAPALIVCTNIFAIYAIATRQLSTSTIRLYTAVGGSQACLKGLPGNDISTSRVGHLPL